MPSGPGRSARPPLSCAPGGSLPGAAAPMSDIAEQLPDPDALLAALAQVSYLADEPLGTALFLAARMGQPILLEGEPGVGKTEAAKALRSEEHTSELQS